MSELCRIVLHLATGFTSKGVLDMKAAAECMQSPMTAHHSQ